MARPFSLDSLYDHKFDPKTHRHYVNDTLCVLHCHHYMALYIQLALDTGKTELLAECARSTYRQFLTQCYEKTAAVSIEEKIQTAVQAYAMQGLGKLSVIYFGSDSGEFELSRSHCDSGWVKKWGVYDKPINSITPKLVDSLR